MCFSPKISTPKPSTQAPEPAPLSEDVASVDIGSSPDDSTKETKGISDLKVKKDSESSKPKDKSAVSRAMRSSGVNLG